MSVYFLSSVPYSPVFPLCGENNPKRCIVMRNKERRDKEAVWCYNHHPYHKRILQLAQYNTKDHCCAKSWWTFNCFVVSAWGVTAENWFPVSTPYKLVVVNHSHPASSTKRAVTKWHEASVLTSPDHPCRCFEVYVASVCDVWRRHHLAQPQFCHPICLNPRFTGFIRRALEGYHRFNGLFPRRDLMSVWWSNLCRPATWSPVLIFRAHWGRMWRA